MINNKGVKKLSKTLPKQGITGEFVKNMFKGITKHYDLLNGVLSLGIDKIWRKTLAKQVFAAFRGTQGISKPQVLDLASGSGALAFAIAKEFEIQKQPCEIIGIDFCEELLAVAQKNRTQKIGHARLCTVEFTIGDALAIPLPDASVDAITIGFGLRNFESRPRSYTEILRVLRPGGRVFILEFSKSAGIIRVLYDLYNPLIPLLAKIFGAPKESYDYLNDSIAAFPGAPALKCELEVAGFVEAKFRRLTGGIVGIHEGRKPTDTERDLAKNRRKAIEEWAKNEGLAVGFAPIEPDLKAEYFLRWINEKKNAGMRWMKNKKRINPEEILGGAKTVVVIGMNYYHPIQAPKKGRIAAYAHTKDYHKTLLKKLRDLCALMQGIGGEQKPMVDTGPVLEKRFAAATQLGWQGKNTVLLSENFGPWLTLGMVFTTLRLPLDTPHADRCGSCTRCQKACPAGALAIPYQLDARKCLAYWTIEHKGEIPPEICAIMGDRLFGCDDCLTACPWNKFAKESMPIETPEREYPSAEEILKMNEAKFTEVFADTPIKRLGLQRLQRNARVVITGGACAPGFRNYK